MLSAEPVCSCAFFCACLHTRPRVQRAPGIPCALFFWGESFLSRPGRFAPRECGGAFGRHCEPTGRANARPMTGSAKQSISPRKERMDCFAALAMTWRVSATLCRRRPQIEPKSRRVLDTPHAGYDGGISASSWFAITGGLARTGPPPTQVCDAPSGSGRRHALVFYPTG